MIHSVRSLSQGSSNILLSITICVLYQEVGALPHMLSTFVVDLHATKVVSRPSVPDFQEFQIYGPKVFGGVVAEQDDARFASDPCAPICLWTNRVWTRQLCHVDLLCQKASQTCLFTAGIPVNNGD